MKWIPVAFCALLSLSLAACNDNVSKSNPVTQTEKQAIGATNDPGKELPYWHDNMSRTGEEGYIDTFSIANTRFRLIHHDTLQDGIVEKWSGSTWQRIIELPQIGNHNTYTRERDINGDGYNDFQYHRKWDEDVFVFDPAKASFSDIPIKNFFTDWTLLDTARNIYYGYQEAKFVDGEYTALYTFKGLTPYYLYYINFEADTTFRRYTKKITLFKCIGGDKNKLEKIENIPFQVAEEEEYLFDAPGYWTANYKSLVGIQ